MDGSRHDRREDPTNFGNQTTLYLDGDDGGGVDLSSLIRWTVTGIPAGSIVQSASITVRITDGSTNSYSIYAVLKSWGESQTTWQNATSSTAWQLPGAMGAADRGAQIGTVTGSKGNVATPKSCGVRGVARGDNFAHRGKAFSGR